MKKMPTIVMIFLIAFSAFSILAPKVKANDELGSSSPPAGYTPKVPDEINGSATALLIEDVLPWAYDSDALALNQLGISYDLTHSVNLQSVNLAEYKFIILASDQPTSTYVNIANNIAQIDSYVSNGGIYVAHACDAGWHYGDWTGYEILPGGVTHVNYWHGGYYSQFIEVVDPSSPIVTGLDSAYFQGWGYSTHGWFTNVPDGANIVMDTGSSKPTYIVYSYGAGKVLATMQTIEWGWSGVYNWVGGFRKEFLLNEISYAQTLMVPVAPKILPVPYYYQGATQWCVPTSMAMIFKYYGQNIHSWDIAKDWGWGRDIQWFWQPTRGMIRDYFEAHGLNTEDGPIDFSVVKTWIDADVPILCWVSWWEKDGLIPKKKSHMVVLIGYSLNDGTPRVYVSDPGGTLVSEKMKLPVSYPYIAVETDWDSLKEYIDSDVELMGVKGVPQPPEGSIDIQDYGVYFSHTEKPNFPQVYSWLYGLDKGLTWENFPLHPLALDSRDYFQFSQYVVNHMKGHQTYYLEVEFETRLSETKWYLSSNLFLVDVEGYSSNPDMIGPVALRDLLSYRGEYTITVRLWDKTVTQLYDEVVFPPIKYSPLIEFYLACPANLCVTDPQGLHVGFDPSTGQAVNEISGAVYSGPGSEPQVIAIPDPLDGNYEVLLIGTATGNYSVTTEFVALQQTITQNYSGEIVEGAVYAYSVTLSDGAITTNPDPIAELRHLKEFIDSLPPENFKYPKLAGCLKKALSNKIDEVILKIEAGNYTDAINKLLYDVRAKMDGDSTAEDWITDPTTQYRICVIIDHIISNIEMLREQTG